MRIKILTLMIAMMLLMVMIVPIVTPQSESVSLGKGIGKGPVVILGKLPGLLNNVNSTNFWDGLNTPADILLNDLGDVNAPSPSNNDTLTWNTATNMWIAQAGAGGGGAGNTTQEIRNAVNFSGEYIFTANKSLFWDNLNLPNVTQMFDSIGILTINESWLNTLGFLTGNIFDQVLNKSSNVTFNDMILTGNLTVDGDTLVVDKVNNMVGIGTSTPEFLFHAQGSSFPVIMADRSTSETSVIRSSMGVGHSTDGNMADGFGTALVIRIKDSADTWNSLASFGGYRDGGDGEGAAFISIAQGGALSGNEIMTFRNSGLVGIGTDSPTQRLDVNGSVNVTGNISASFFTGDGSLLINLPIGNPFDQVLNKSSNVSFSHLKVNGTSATDVIIIAQTTDNSFTNNVFEIQNSSGDCFASFDHTGTLGVGTCAPDFAMHFQQPFGAQLAIESLRANDQSAVKVSFLRHGDETFAIGLNTFGSKDFSITDESGEATPLRIEIGGPFGETMRLTNTSRVGIGTSAPAFPLHVVGNISTISIFSDGNISAGGYITRTKIWNKTKRGNARQYLKDSNDLRNPDGTINHSAIVPGGAIKHNTTIKVGERIIFYNDTKIVRGEIIIIPKNRTENIYEVKEIEGVFLDDWIAKLEQALYESSKKIEELEEENELIMVELCAGRNTYSWC